MGTRDRARPRARRPPRSSPSPFATPDEAMAGLARLPALPDSPGTRPQHRLLLRDPPGLASRPAAHRLPGGTALAHRLSHHLRARDAPAPGRGQWSAYVSDPL